MREVLAKLTAILDKGDSSIFCSVVETRGSTPQKAGAAMLVFPDGSQCGTLGGGCVEAEVKRRALQSLTQASDPEILSFCLDEDYGWDDGLICGGRMTMLVHSFSASNSNGSIQSSRSYYRAYQELLDLGLGCTEAVIIDADGTLRPGHRYLFNGVGTLAEQLGNELPEKVRADLQPLRNRPRPFARRGVAYLPTWPRITLLIV